MNILINCSNLKKGGGLQVADSFHGTIFSMKLKTPFVTYISEPGRKARFKQLEEQFDIKKFIVSSLKELQETNPQKGDYNKTFAQMSNVGRTFLKDSLNS